ncbi:MAG: response regulator transcription factor [Anaerolineales bacterium]|nr:response regulator transcription factor [Anaerolineales bacterium]
MTQTGVLPDKLRVLIADDVTETRRSTRLMMTMLPSAEVVAIAKNGREAVELARLHQPDLVLIDVNMPQMNGITAVRTMVDERPFTACIVISAERDPQTLIDAISAGARGYLTKPFTADQLMEAIRRVMKLVQAGRRSHTAGPANSQEAQFFKQQRDRFLKELANEYIRTRRTDERAMEVLEVLAEDPQCETRLLTALAMIYALNHRWSKLQALAARLTEQDTA